jgi:hypothetical protein
MGWIPKTGQVLLPLLLISIEYGHPSQAIWLMQLIQNRRLLDRDEDREFFCQRAVESNKLHSLEWLVFALRFQPQSLPESALARASIASGRRRIIYHEQLGYTIESILTKLPKPLIRLMMGYASWK